MAFLQLVALFVTIFTQAGTQSVARLVELRPELGGLDVTASGVGDCVIFVNADPEQKRLAEFLSKATLTIQEKAQAGNRLVPDKSQRTTIGRKFRANAYAKPVAELAATAFDGAKPEEHGADYVDRLLDQASRIGPDAPISLPTPFGDLLDRMLIEMGPDALGSLPLDSVVVYSSKPMPGEKGLPATASKAFTQFGKFLTVVSQLLPSRAAQRGLSNELPRIREQAAQGLTATRAILLLQRSSRSVWCLLGLYTPEGRRAGTAVRTLPYRPDLTTKGAPTRVEPVHLTQPSLDIDFTIRKLSQKATDGLSLPICAKIIAPESNEPLGGAMHESLASLYAAEQRPVIICVPSSWMLRPVPLKSDSTLDMVAFTRRLASELEVASDDKDALILRPANADDELDHGLDKHQIEKSFAEAVRKKGWTLRSYLSAYSRSNVNLSNRSDWFTLLGALDRLGVWSPRPELELPAAMRFLGALSESQWNELLKSRSIPLGAMGLRQKQDLLDWTNRSLLAGKKLSQAPEVTDNICVGSEAFARGALTTARLQVDIRSEDVLKLASCPDSQRSFWPSDEMNLNFVRQRMANLRQNGDLSGDITWYWGKRTTYVFSVVVEPGIAFEQSIPWSLENASLKPATLEELPEEIRAALKG